MPSPRDSLPAVTPAFDPETPAGIGGWLLLMLLGLVLTPLRVAWSTYGMLQPVLMPGVWEQLTEPGHPAYHPLWAPLIVAETAGNGLTLLLALLALWLFLRRSRRAPAVIIGLFVWSLLFAITDQAATGLIPMIPPPTTETLIDALVAPAVAVAIWVPYLLRSKRVRATFVL
ncbi:DUF2569 family protein [Plasticicumulans sp.]|uniref:DUF2569 family protein n=1 Tax=Plasticicumulans sp. TaxID=2307179 RepID=UPI003922B6C4